MKERSQEPQRERDSVDISPKNLGMIMNIMIFKSESKHERILKFIFKSTTNFTHRHFLWNSYTIPQYWFIGLVKQGYKHAKKTYFVELINSDKRGTRT